LQTTTQASQISSIQRINQTNKKKEITRAVMESTGSYWCGLYDELERNGIDVSL
jgi:transposase